MPKPPVFEYALYKGEEILAMGTMNEIAEQVGCSPKTLSFYTTPAYKKRIQKRQWTNNNYRYMVKIGLVSEREEEDGFEV